MSIVKLISNATQTEKPSARVAVGIGEIARAGAHSSARRVEVHLGASKIAEIRRGVIVERLENVTDVYSIAHLVNCQTLEGMDASHAVCHCVPVHLFSNEVIILGR